MKKKQSNKYDLIFENEDYLIINKAASLLSIPDRYNAKLENLFDILNSIYGKIFTVHRLDKDTSGIMIFAKNENAHRYFSLLFQNQEIQRIYHVVIDGVLPQDSLEVDIPIIANPAKKGLSMPSARGKHSLSIFRKIEEFRHSSLVEVQLITGRHHQIRVHASAIGNPLLVDRDYGNRTEFYLSKVKRKFNLKKNTEEQPIIDRLSMHAYQLKFKDFKSREIVNFTAEYPKDFNVLVKQLRKYDNK